MTFRNFLIAGSAAAGFALIAGGASAATLPVPAEQAVTAPLEFNGEAIEQVQNRRQQRRWNRWERRHHGPRYRYRRHGYHHYHRGYWYSTPWWAVTVPLVAPTIVAPAPVYGGGGHVAWCEARYRSYDPSTDQFLGYDGDYHYCNSPYR